MSRHGRALVADAPVGTSPLQRRRVHFRNLVPGTPSFRGIRLLAEQRRGYHVGLELARWRRRSVTKHGAQAVGDVGRSGTAFSVANVSGGSRQRTPARGVGTLFVVAGFRHFGSDVRAERMYVVEVATLVVVGLGRHGATTFGHRRQSGGRTRRAFLR